MNVQQEIKAANDVLAEANTAAPAESIGVWEHFFEPRHRDTAITVWTFGLRVGGIFVALMGPAAPWSWAVSYGGPKGHAETAAEALAAAREAAQPEARRWARSSAAAS